MENMLLGAIAMTSLSIGLVFYRFWRSTHDRFFLYFTIAFWIEGLNRIHFGLTGAERETTPSYYVIRLVAYGLILLAILEKNRPRDQRR